MSITGAPDAEGGEPDQGRRRDQRRPDRDARRGRGARRARRARARRAARRAGAGQRVDVSLLGATLASLVNQAQNAFVSGVAPGRLGNAHPNIVPYETFDTADGAIAVAVGSERQWPRLCAALGLPGLADGSALRDQRRPRRAPRRACARSWPSAFAARTTADWLRRPRGGRRSRAGPINDILAAFASPEAIALGMTVEQEHPAWGVDPPGRASRSSCRATPASIRTPPPTLGQDTDAILAELG